MQSLQHSVWTHSVCMCADGIFLSKDKASLQGITGLRHIPVFSGTNMLLYCVTASGVILTLTALLSFQVQVYHRTV